MAWPLSPGLLLPKDSQLLGVQLYNLLGFRQCVLQGLKMLVIPLVISSVICGGGWHRQPEIRPHGVAHRRHLYRLYQQRRAGGFIDGEFIYPGIHNGKPASDLLNLLDAEQVATQAAKVAERDGGDIAGVFCACFPPT